MKHDFSLTEGDITRTLFKLALPVIAANLFQTLLGLFDIVWVGKLGSEAVSAIGTASFYINFATALTTLVTIGAGAKIAYSLGSGDRQETKEYIKSSVIITIFISLLFSGLCFIFMDSLLSFFNIDNYNVIGMAKEYFTVSLFGMPFMFLTSLYTIIYTSFGQTKASFKANTVGLVVNLVLDPIFIFGFGMIPKLGVMGAAMTNNIAHILSAGLLIIFANAEIKSSLKAKFKYWKSMEIMKLSFPITLQRILFTFIAMIMTRILVSFSADA